MYRANLCSRPLRGTSPKSRRCPRPGLLTRLDLSLPFLTFPKHSPPPTSPPFPPHHSTRHGLPPPRPVDCRRDLARLRPLQVGTPQAWRPLHQVLRGHPPRAFVVFLFLPLPESCADRYCRTQLPRLRLSPTSESLPTPPISPLTRPPSAPLAVVRPTSSTPSPATSTSSPAPTLSAAVVPLSMASSSFPRVPSRQSRWRSSTSRSRSSATTPR